MWPALIAAGASIAGSALNYISGKNANDANVEAVREANNANREAYQNRYQWQSQDMEKAGLNKALSYTQSPGNAPTAQAALQQASNPGDPLKEVSNAYSRYLDNQNAKMQNELITAQANSAKEQALNISADTAQKVQQTKYINATTAIEQMRGSIFMARQQAELAQILEQTGLTREQSRKTAADTMGVIITNRNLNDLQTSQIGLNIANTGQAHSQTALNRITQGNLDEVQKSQIFLNNSLGINKDVDTGRSVVDALYDGIDFLRGRNNNPWRENKDGSLEFKEQPTKSKRRRRK